jgi:hypothetical protein
VIIVLLQRWVDNSTNLLWRLADCLVVAAVYFFREFSWWRSTKMEFDCSAFLENKYLESGSEVREQKIPEILQLEEIHNKWAFNLMKTTKLNEIKTNSHSMEANPNTNPTSDKDGFEITQNEYSASEDIPVRIDSSKVRELISSAKNPDPIAFPEILPRALAEITEHNQWTFNPMKATKLDAINAALSGQNESLMPHSLLDLADHLVTFDKYDSAFPTYMEAVSIGLRLYEIDSKPEIAWLVHDALLGIAKIIREGESPLSLADSVEVSLKIFQYLASTFECDEAKSYLSMDSPQI